MESLSQKAYALKILIDAAKLFFKKASLSYTFPKWMMVLHLLASILALDIIGLKPLPVWKKKS